MTDPIALRAGEPVRMPIAEGGSGPLGAAAGPGPERRLGEGTVGMTDEARFINRELSWLEFGARLLVLSADERIPLSERVKFMCIFTEGLDEFFQVRVASLEDQVAAGLHTRSPDGLNPIDQLEAVTARATALVAWQSRIFRDELSPALAAAGIHLVRWGSLDPKDRAHLAEVFDRHIFPILTPLAVDQAHPFPYISDLSLNLVVRVVSPTTGEERIARVKVPPLLPRFVALPDGGRFVVVEQVIAAHLDAIFPNMTIVEHHAFRVTRNADVSVEEDEADDLLAAVELELRRRRFGQAVRLEVEAGLPADLLAMLIAEVDVPEGNVYLTEVPIDLGGLRSLVELGRPELAPPVNVPVTSPRLAAGGDLFAVLAEHDVLVHHPYESFVTSVEAFLAAAADDPDVVAIKQTLYRTGDESPVVTSLIRASQTGKQVTAVVELQARFDEQANIGWARALEEAGVQVIYGLVSLKTHAKISLVLRREGDELRRYSHIGTGNYNTRTALGYEDVGLLTASPDIGADLGQLFNLLTGSRDRPTFGCLVVSPVSARSSLVEAIDEEAQTGAAGRIVLKTNGLTDPAVIDALYRASQAGVAVDLIVRERCCLRPGVPGLSDRIKVRSIVGRYLEHSRLFRFGGTGQRPLRVWIGSADLMERNLDRRVEVIVPIDDPELQRRVVGMLDDALRDEANSWILGRDATWTRRAGPGPLGFSLQDHLEAQALASLRDRVESPLGRPAAQRAVPGPALQPEPSPPAVSAPWWRRVRRREL
ncbi:MAG: polyphosphate kinase 1 [Acidimicrobiales bacterium]